MNEENENQLKENITNLLTQKNEKILNDREKMKIDKEVERMRKKVPVLVDKKNNTQIEM